MSQFAGIDVALQLVTQHFEGILDEDGEPYLLHCLRVMQDAGDDPDTRLVALMHDLVEDTPVTLDALRSAGFSPAVVEAVGLITHTADVSYCEYVVRLKPNAAARAAKLSDLRDNAGLHRILYREDDLQRDIHRIQKYILSYQFLEDRISEQEYRRRMEAI